MPVSFFNPSEVRPFTPLEMVVVVIVGLAIFVVLDRYRKSEDRHDLEEVLLLARQIVRRKEQRILVRIKR